MRRKAKALGGIAAIIMCGIAIVVTGGTASAGTGDSPTVASIRNEPPDLATFNWAGYVQDGTSGEFTAVKDKWRVPTVAMHATGDYYSQQIVGIGGYGSDQTFVEAGTEVDDMDGKAVDKGFYEDPDTGKVFFSGFKIHPGDVIAAAVEEIETNGWAMSVADLTTGISESVAVIYSSSGQSAEAALDRPCLSGNCYVEVSGLANLVKTSDITFSKGEISTSAPSGDPSWVPLMSSVSNSTLDNLFMKNDQMSEIIACASNPSSDNEGFTAAHGKNQPPPPSK